MKLVRASDPVIAPELPMYPALYSDAWYLSSFLAYRVSSVSKEC